ncbi:MAG: hypothetical protein GX892_12755 [Thermoanaerobacteraceae bacterium]|nr:hypothetical protein [Thermoanaerobacteraceae bacterium]
MRADENHKVYRARKVWQYLEGIKVARVKRKASDVYWLHWSTAFNYEDKWNNLPQ